MTTKLKSLGFTSGHAHLLIVAVALFSVLMVAKSDLSVKALFANADDEVEMLTYEDVRSEVVAEYGGVSSEADAEAEKQLALLDRSLDNGQVLGDMVGIGTIPNIDKIFARDQLDMIPVTTIATTQQSVQIYSERVIGVEAEHGAVALMANLNSSDQAVLTQTKDQVVVVISNLKGLSVPAELADFHRYKMIYYQTLASMADAFANNTLDANFQNTSKILFSVMEKIESTKTEMQTKYQVSL